MPINADSVSDVAEEFPFEAVFFDMDGITVDTEPLWHQSEAELMATFNYAWSKEDEVHCLGGPLSRVGMYMAELVGNPHPGSWFTDALIRMQLEKMRRDTPILPGVLSTIASLRQEGVPVALVSASPRTIVDVALEVLPQGLFDFSISFDDAPRTKPHPDPYLVAASKAQVEITRSLVVEDSLTGIAAGKAAGAYVLAVPHYIDVLPEERVAVTSSLVGMDVQVLSSLFNRSAI